jgi:PAS domain S-box-containing protein
MAEDLQDLKAMWLELRTHVDRLARERQQYLEFFEQSPEAYVATDAQGNIYGANGAAVDVLLRRKRYLCGKPLVAMVALDQRAEFRRRLREIASGDPQAERTFRTVFVAPELRIGVTLTARLIRRSEGIAGVCWRLDPLQ